MNAIDQTRGMLATPDWTIVFNPRTGSRSLVTALREAGFDVKHGHIRPEWVMKHTQSDRIIGVIRDPMTWCWSHYWKADVYPDVTFENWLDQVHDHIGIYWGKGLNAYRDIITEYWLFDRGYPDLLSHLGIGPVTTHHVGQSVKHCEPRWYDRITEYFPDDCAMYESVARSFQ